MRKGKGKRVKGIIIISDKKYSIKLTMFPKTDSMVEVMNNFYVVKKIKFKEVKNGMIPIIYLVKTTYVPKIRQ